MNLVVVQGLVRDDPVARSLSSGQQVISFELAVRTSEEALESVPIVVFDTACAIAPDDEVVASRIVPARRRAQVTKALGQAIDVLSGG